LSQDPTAAVWDKGFTRFLKAPDELNDILKKLKV
jgi:hypothetical protein